MRKKCTFLEEREKSLKKGEPGSSGGKMETFALLRMDERVARAWWGRGERFGGKRADRKGLEMN